MASRTGLIDRTVAHLRDAVVNGTWPVGSRIPTETDLAATLGVGRNTVREAVQSLVHSGLLARRQGSGTYVLSDSELTVALSRQIAHVHQQHILEVRRSLEVEAARLAAQRRTERDITTIRTLNERREQSFADGEINAMVTTDLALHRAIVAAARNPLLLDLYENLIDAIGDSIRANVETDHPDHSHHELVEAIADGDDERAALEIYRYLEEYLATLQR